MHIASNTAVDQAGGSLVAVPETRIDARSRVTRTAEAVADLEYSIRLHQWFKKSFAIALKLHIALSIVFYALLGAHLGAAMQYGFRWWS